MSPRKRHPRNAPFPDGLRVRDGYYSYTSPLDGREKGLGRDRMRAIQWARDANVEVQRIRGQQSAAEWVRGESTKNWGAWLDRYQELLAEREIAPKTKRFYLMLLRRARAQWPAATSITAVSTAQIAEAIASLKTEGKRRMAQAYRAWLSDCFRCCIAEGWRTDNPVAVTDKVRNKTKRARLTLEHVQAILAADTTKPWLRNAIALALVSGQRREDIVRAQRRDVRDGAWWCEQHKTKVRLAIPLSLRLVAFGASLADVLDQCRGTSILSHHIVHQTTRKGGSKLGEPIYPAAVTREFSAAVARLGIDWGDRTPPTFHELRSLSKRLYDSQGGVNTQQLLGHMSPESAAIYADGRGEWVKVSIG